MAHPNILILMTDQQRFDALGCAGNPEIRTPNLDALAHSGIYFRNACTPTPVCVAARMSFITGHRASRHHYVTNQSLPGPAPELPTIMTCLHAAGYHTQGIGKMHFRGRHYGFGELLRMEEGVDHRVDDDYLLYLKEQGVRTRYPQGLRDLLYYQPQTCGIPAEHSKSGWVTKKSVEFLHEHVKHRRDKPFFLWSSWIAPHPPFAPSEPYDALYDPAAMGLPIYPERPAAGLPAWGSRARLDGAHLDPDRIRRIRALYYGLVTQIDDGVGEILGTLGQLGLRDDTVVLFVSDHGDMLGDHGLSQKNVPYEASMRIPMILRWPGRTKPGRICDDLVGLEDVLPTLIRGLGLDYLEQAGPLPGEDLLSREGGGLASGRDAYFIDYGHGAQRWIALRTQRWKYAIWAAGGFEELYDLDADPWECCNLAETQPDLAAGFRERVLAWERKHGLSDSLDGGKLRVHPRREPPHEFPRGVTVNEGPWPENLPEDEQHTVETYAEAFTRAIAKEDSLSPEKLSLADYKRKGGHPLVGTPWEDAWRQA